MIPQTTKIAVTVTAAALCLSCAHGASFFNISQIVVEDNGTDITLDSSSNYTPVGDANLKSFTIGTTTYDATDFISGVSVDEADIQAPGLVQPAGFLSANDAKFTDGNPTSQFYTGSDNPASFLAHGSRGLSMSTAINVTDKDNDASIRFPASILDASAFGDGTPDFVFGDGANNQSTDLVRFLDGTGGLVAEIQIAGTNGTPGNGVWSNVGTHLIDRIEIDGSGHRSGGNQFTGEVNIVAFEPTSADLESGRSWDEVAEIDIRIPDSSTIVDPRTDYTFFGVNIETIDSPALVIPEPGTYAVLFGIAGLGFALYRRHRRS